jgi:polysaccharide biosynthesis transport protein
MAVKRGDDMQEFSGDRFFQEKETHLSDYLRLLFKRRLLIILVFILSVLVSAFHVSSLVPIYESSARLLVEKQVSSSPITGQRMDYESYYTQFMSYNTSIEMIQSTEVLKEVVAALGLDTKEIRQVEEELEISFIREWWAKSKANIKLLLRSFLPAKEKTAEPLLHEIQENRQRQSLVNMVRGKIKIEKVPDTWLLNISVRDKNPEMAADIANTLARKYMEFNLSNKVESSKQTLEWLNNELYDLRKKLEDDEQKFFEYKQENLVFSIEGKQKQAEQRIQEFNTRYLETRNKRLELDAKINELSRNMGNIKSVANVRSLINNPVIESIYARIIDLEIELTRLSKTYGPKHPQIVQANTELAKSRNSLALEITKEVENLKSEREVLSVREKTLETNIAEFEQEALETSSKELQYTILQRNLDTSRNLYDLMVSRVKESNILQTADTGNIRLVETAQVPVSPVFPDKRRTMLIGMLLGLFAGCGLAFFFEYLDRTVRTEEDLHQHFNLPVLSVIPKADRSVS